MTKNKIVTLNKRQNDIFMNMRYEAKRIYDIENNWNWSISTYWDENERNFDTPKIKIIAESKLRNAELSLKLQVFTQEKFELETGILKQVIKFCDERIKIYKEF